METKLKYFLALDLVVFFLLTAAARCSQIYVNSSSHPFIGAPTNGYFARITTSGKNNCNLCVFIQRPPGTSTLYARTNFYSGPNYLMATNWFPGPCEMKNNKGELLPILKPNLISSNAYPDTLSWKNLLNAKDETYSGPVPGNGLLFEAGKNNYIEDCNLGTYDLNELYNVTNSGDYTLTVYPKIYKKTGPHEDTYRRIDLPPIIVPVHCSD